MYVLIFNFHTAPTEAIKQAHRQYLESKISEGKLIAAGAANVSILHENSTQAGAVLLATCHDLSDAKELFDADPYANCSDGIIAEFKAKLVGESYHNLSQL
ncbi:MULTISPECIES: YciI family protein [Cysteiniphilum]|uniref:YciI family protein n=1 Tax=Cysteiniphilum TaxID=2056696 RepID=UPI0017842C2D|nr:MULTISPECIES: YciI family protein [Cysteiniphilum]